MNPRRLLVPFLAAVAIAGCNDRPAPRLQAPLAESWPTAPAAAEPSARADAAQADAWWTGYGDAQLDALVVRALARQPRLAAAAAVIDEARARASAAGADYRPQLAAKASASRFRDSEHEVLPSDGNAHSRLIAGFDASWEFDLWGRGRQQRALAIAEAEAAGYAAAETRMVVAAEVVAAYVDLRAAQRRRALARRIDACHRQALALANGRAELGAGVPAEAAAIELAWREGTAGVASLDADAACAGYRLCALVAAAPGSAVLGAEPPASDDSRRDRIPGLPRALRAGIPADLLRRRPDILRLEREVAAATAAVGVADADRFPRLALDGSLALDALKLADFATPGALAWAVGPALGWTLFDGGRRRAAVTAAEARAAGAIARWRDRVLEAQREVAEAMARVAACEAELDALRAAERAALAAWRDEDQRLRLGASDARAPLPLALDALRIQDRIAMTEQRRAFATVALAKALGSGWQTPDPAAAPATSTGDPLARATPARDDGRLHPARGGR